MLRFANSPSHQLANCDERAPDWRLSREAPSGDADLERSGIRVVALWRRRLRWQTEGARALRQRSCASGRQPIMAFWHGRILPATYYFRRRGIVVITQRELRRRVDCRHHRGASASARARARQPRWCSKARRLQLAASTWRPGSRRVYRRRTARVDRPGSAAHGCDLAEGDRRPGPLPFHHGSPIDAHGPSTWLGPDADPKPFATVAISMGEPFAVAGGCERAVIELPRASAGAALGRRSKVAATRATAFLT